MRNCKEQQNNSFGRHLLAALQETGIRVSSQKRGRGRGECGVWLLTWWQDLQSASRVAAVTVDTIGCGRNMDIISADFEVFGKVQGECVIVFRIDISFVFRGIMNTTYVRLNERDFR